MMRGVFLVVVFLFPLAAYSQLSTANVSGNVEDISGARLPATTIKLLNLQTGTENLTCIR